MQTNTVRGRTSERHAGDEEVIRDAVAHSADFALIRRFYIRAKQYYYYYYYGTEPRIMSAIKSVIREAAYQH